MLRIAAETLRGRVAPADLRALPATDGALDGIWCTAALLHVPESDARAVLREFRRTLRAAGVLALVTAIGESSRFEDVPYAPGERRWFVYRSPDRLRSQRVAAGLEIVSDARIPSARDWWTVLACAV